MGLMSGPLFGGFILHNYSWRTIFLLNVPISFTVFLGGWLFIAGTIPKYINKNSGFDWFGAMLWGVVVTLAVILFNGHGIWNRYSFFLLVCLLCLVMILFFRFETTRKDPLIPVILLGKRYYRVAMLSVTLSFAVLFFVLILMPFYFNYVLGLTFDKIGYMMMAVPVSLFVVSPLSGRLFDRMGSKYLTFVGLFITGCAVLFLSAITEESSLPDIGWRLSLLGCGQSIFLSPNTASVLSRVRFEDTGISSGMLATCRNLGMLIGVAMVGMIFSFFFGTFTEGGQLGEFRVEQLPQFVRSFRYTLYVAAALAFAGSLISLQRE
jgi:MFS family permease